MNTYYQLTVKCPSCGEELGDGSKLIDGVPAIKLITQIGDQKGDIWLSSYYGSYNYESSVKINEGEITVFKCPHCLKDLISSENCNVCHAPLVDFHLFAGGKVSICSRSGCKKHSVEFEDLNTAINHFYNEFENQKTRLKDKD